MQSSCERRAQERHKWLKGKSVLLRVGMKESTIVFRHSFAGDDDRLHVAGTESAAETSEVTTLATHCHCKSAQFVNATITTGKTTTVIIN